IGGYTTYDEVAKFSRRDADRLAAYSARLETFADVFRELMLATPPNVVAGGWRQALPEVIRAARATRGARALGLGERQELLSLVAGSAGDYLDGWFESDPIKGVYGFDGIVGNYASPYSPGTA